MKAIITVGIPASGKSTWADQFVRNRDDWIVVCRDDIRFGGEEKDWTQYKFTKAREKEVTEQANAMIEMAALTGKNVIIADTNLNEGRRANMERWLNDLGFEVEVKFFDVELRDALSRDANRKGGVGSSVIMKMYLDMYGEKYVGGDGELAYVVDIDGTVAKSHDRGWYDWLKVGQDHVNTHVMNVVKALNAAGYTIVFLSGRDSICREQTKEWLNEHFGTDYELFMRVEGDMRRDSVVKRELFDNYVRDFYNVQAVIDDRPQVIKETWLPMGLNVMCVGNPYIDF